MRSAAFVLLPLVAACAMVRGTAVEQPGVAWRDKATEDDRERLRDWRSAFSDALGAASRSGHAAQIAGAGALLQPDAALANGRIPDGEYRCRTIKLGARSSGMPAYTAYPYFRCRVTNGRGGRTFAKIGGSQRLFGHIYGGDALREVFLGTLVLGDEERAMRYGADRSRDVAGYLERIGPARWRMIMPRPHFESQLDVMELVPAS